MKKRRQQPLTKRQMEAAQLMALDELGIGEIAQKVGVNRATLWEWSKRADFQALVVEHATTIANTLLPYALKRLRKIVNSGSDRDANVAIQTVLKAAQWGKETVSRADQDLDAAIEEAEEE